MENNNENARNQAKAQLASITAMVAALNCDYDWLGELKEELESLTEGSTEWHAWREENVDEYEELRKAAGDCTSEEDARQRIEEDALSVEVRSGWAIPGVDMEPEEFKILLCTGGPAVQIIGDLNSYNEPESCHLMYQDWFTPWEELQLTEEEQEAVLTYCRVFYFGE